MVVDLRRVLTVGEVSVRIWRADAVEIQCDAIVCGKDLGAALVAANRAHGNCSDHPYEPESEFALLHVTPLDLLTLPAQWIGILNPADRAADLAALLGRAMAALAAAKPRAVERITLVAPWRNGASTVAALAHAIRSVLANPPPGLRVLNLVDADDPSDFERMFPVQ